jgi:hypothetical protein
MDHIAASLDQTSGSFNQPLESKWLGKHGNLPEGLWKSFPGVSGDEEEGHLAPRQSRRDLAYRPAVQVAVEQCSVQFGVFDNLQRLFGRAGRCHHFGARIFQTRLDVEGDDWLIFDHQKALSLQFA